jgi:hypothetical protein
MIREDGRHQLTAYSILISLMWWFMRRLLSLPNTAVSTGCLYHAFSQFDRTIKLWGFTTGGGAFMHPGEFTAAREAVKAHNGEALSGEHLPPLRGG